MGTREPPDLALDLALEILSHKFALYAIISRSLLVKQNATEGTPTTSRLAPYEVPSGAAKGPMPICLQTACNAGIMHA
jgi:hypothetical protein